MKFSDPKETAKKAKNGDSEALGLLILAAPAGALDDKEPDDYAAEMAGEESEEPSRTERMKSALEEAGVEVDDETAAKVCEAYHASA